MSKWYNAIFMHLREICIENSHAPSVPSTRVKLVCSKHSAADKSTDWDAACWAFKPCFFSNFFYKFYILHINKYTFKKYTFKWMIRQYIYIEKLLFYNYRTFNMVYSYILTPAIIRIILVRNLIKNFKIIFKLCFIFIYFEILFRILFRNVWTHTLGW